MPPDPHNKDLYNVDYLDRKILDMARMSYPNDRLQFEFENLGRYSPAETVQRIREEPRYAEMLVDTLQRMAATEGQTARRLTDARDAFEAMLAAWDIAGCDCELSDCEACSLVEDSRDVLEKELKREDPNKPKMFY